MNIFRIGLVLAVLCVPTTALAQWGYIGYAQTSVTNTSGGVALDASQLNPSGQLRPTQAFCIVEDAPIRWTIDGTAPTTTVGNYAAADTALPAIAGTTLLANFRAIRTGGSNALLSCNYFAGGSLPFREWGGTTATSTGGGGGGGGLTDTELRASAVPVSVASVPSHAVTNGGTFVVQENGGALTALQLIDNPVGSASGGTAGTSSYLSGGVYNSSPPTLTNGQQAAAQVDVNGYHKVNVAAGSGIAADSCADSASVLTKIISIASGTTTELVAISGSTTVTVCGLQLTVGGAINLTLKRGTGSACGTGTTAIGPAWHFTTDGDGIVIPPGNKVVSGTSGNAVCLTTSAGSSVEGLMQYVQQ